MRDIWLNNISDDLLKPNYEYPVADPHEKAQAAATRLRFALSLVYHNNAPEEGAPGSIGSNWGESRAQLRRDLTTLGIPLPRMDNMRKTADRSFVCFWDFQESKQGKRTFSAALILRAQKFSNNMTSHLGRLSLSSDDASSMRTRWTKLTKLDITPLSWCITARKSISQHLVFPEKPNTIRLGNHNPTAVIQSISQSTTLTQSPASLLPPKPVATPEEIQLQPSTTAIETQQSQPLVHPARQSLIMTGSSSSAANSYKPTQLIPRTGATVTLLPTPPSSASLAPIKLIPLSERVESSDENRSTSLNTTNLSTDIPAKRVRPPEDDSQSSISVSKKIKVSDDGGSKAAPSGSIMPAKVGKKLQLHLKRLDDLLDYCASSQSGTAEGLDMTAMSPPLMFERLEAKIHRLIRASKSAPVTPKTFVNATVQAEISTQQERKIKELETALEIEKEDRDRERKDQLRERKEWERRAGMAERDSIEKEAAITDLREERSVLVETLATKSKDVVDYQEKCTRGEAERKAMEEAAERTRLEVKELKRNVEEGECRERALRARLELCADQMRKGEEELAACEEKLVAIQQATDPEVNGVKTLLAEAAERERMQLEELQNKEQRLSQLELQFNSVRGSPDERAGVAKGHGVTGEVSGVEQRGLQELAESALLDIARLLSIPI